MNIDQAGAALLPLALVSWGDNRLMKLLLAKVGVRLAHVLHELAVDAEDDVYSDTAPAKIF
ncbi:hypothetical protein T492DRAFT_976019 [Pavlovales sp. CCMP2436]|nr:hypothetical protein T492DRAFT_976019 [Pavlovales sp. CCMP2436]